MAVPGFMCQGDDFTAANGIGGESISKAGENERGWLNFFRPQQQKIEIKGLFDEVIREAAVKTEGFSGREIVKLMASVQVVVYGSKVRELDANMFHEVVDYKVAEHQQRRKLAGEGATTA